MHDSDNLKDKLSTQLLWDEVKVEVMERLEAIAEVLEGKIAHRISNYQPYPIYYTGEFLNKLQHNVTEDGNDIVMQIWSHTPHAKFVLGGMVPQWVALDPLVKWVERKRLSWVDKQGKKLTAIQMATIIQLKIKRVGVKERNVFREILEEEMSWIEEQLSNIKGDKL